MSQTHACASCHGHCANEIPSIHCSPPNFVTDSGTQ
jgi:hypothetical protein